MQPLNHVTEVVDCSVLAVLYVVSEEAGVQDGILLGVRRVVSHDLPCGGEGNIQEQERDPHDTIEFNEVILIGGSREIGRLIGLVFGLGCLNDE